jgi:hypothetical protein
MWEMRNMYKILVGKPEGKKPIRRPRCRWEHNIKINLKTTGLDGMDWIHVAQDGDQWQDLVNMVMNFQVP